MSRGLARAVGAVLLFCAITAAPSRAAAIRPFITDDARVVGGGHAQIETWVRLDHASFQHWALAAIGPIAPLEVTVGAVHGAAYGHHNPLGAEYTVGAPLLQAKFLLWEPRPNRWPGLAVSAGMIGPLGTGPLRVNGWDFFEYVALTESLGDRERLLVHANVGVAGSSDPAHGPFHVTWGVGAQVRTVAGLHAVGELFSGDPYASGGGGASGAMQVGFRYIFSDFVQLDGTFGIGLWGAHPLPPWGTLGLRLASARWF